MNDDMSDRKLLELAAMAAGFEEIKYQEPADWFEIRYGMSHAVWNGEEYWNPLEDDGDALRLAVTLHMLVDGDGDVYAVSTATPKGRGIMASEPHRGDPYAATRRAIVRAAAEIGKAMP